MKVFAEDNSNVVKMMDFVFDGVENIVRSREIVGEQDFSFFLRMSKSFSSEC